MDHQFAMMLNKLVDMTFAFINTLMALFLVVGPWFRVTADGTYLGCPLTRGTVIVPFSSGLCQYDSFSDLPDGLGAKWASLENTVIVFFVFSIISSLL